MLPETPVTRTTPVTPAPRKRAAATRANAAAPRTRAGLARVLPTLVVLALAVRLTSLLAACGDKSEPIPPMTGTGATSDQAAPAASAAPTTASDASTSPVSMLTGGGLPPGCRCHSKNKQLAAMHKLFSAEDCEKCHGPDEDLMAAGDAEWTPEHKAELVKRMRSEAICLECHQSEDTAVPARYTVMNGRLFCPTDSKLYTKAEAVMKDGVAYCPDHDVPLVDVDKIAAASTKTPKNEYCVACHQPSDTLTAKHANVFAATSAVDQADCLACHESHSKCGGCHY